MLARGRYRGDYASLLDGYLRGATALLPRENGADDADGTGAFLWRPRDGRSGEGGAGRSFFSSILAGPRNNRTTAISGRSRGSRSGGVAGSVGGGAAVLSAGACGEYVRREVARASAAAAATADSTTAGYSSAAAGTSFAAAAAAAVATAAAKAVSAVPADELCRNSLLASTGARHLRSILPTATCASSSSFSSSSSLSRCSASGSALLPAFSSLRTASLRPEAWAAPGGASGFGGLAALRVLDAFALTGGFEEGANAAAAAEEESSNLDDLDQVVASSGRSGASLLAFSPTASWSQASSPSLCRFTAVRDGRHFGPLDLLHLAVLAEGTAALWRDQGREQQHKQEEQQGQQRARQEQRGPSSSSAPAATAEVVFGSCCPSLCGRAGSSRLARVMHGWGGRAAAAEARDRRLGRACAFACPGPSEEGGGGGGVDGSDDDGGGGSGYGDDGLGLSSMFREPRPGSGHAGMPSGGQGKARSFAELRSRKARDAKHWDHNSGWRVELVLLGDQGAGSSSGDDGNSDGDNGDVGGYHGDSDGDSGGSGGGDDGGGGVGSDGPRRGAGLRRGRPNAWRGAATENAAAAGGASNHLGYSGDGLGGGTVLGGAAATVAGACPDVCPVCPSLP